MKSLVVGPLIQLFKGENPVLSKPVIQEINKIDDSEARLAAIFACSENQESSEVILEMIQDKESLEKIIKKLETETLSKITAKNYKRVNKFLTSLDLYIKELCQITFLTIDYLLTSERFTKKRQERLDKVIKYLEDNCTPAESKTVLKLLEDCEKVSKSLDSEGFKASRIIKIKIELKRSLESFIKKIEESNKKYQIDLNTLCPFLSRGITQYRELL
jgi:hypothetical protein